MGVLKFYIPELWISNDTDTIINHLLKDIETAGLLDYLSSIQRYKDHIELLIPDDAIPKFCTLNIDIDGVHFHFISKEEKILIINIYGLELDTKWTNVVHGINKFGQPVRYLEHKKTYNGRTLKTGVRSIWIKRETVLPGIISDKMSEQGEDIECIELGKEELEYIDLGRIKTKLEEKRVTNLEEKTVESSNSGTENKKPFLKADKRFVDKAASKIPRAQSLNSCDRVSRTKGLNATTKIPRAYSLNSADKISRVSSLAVKKVPRASSLTTADRSSKASDKITRAKSLTSADRKSIRFAKPVKKTNGISVKAENNFQSKPPVSPTENLEMDCIERILKRTESVKNKLKTVKSTVRALPVKRVESVRKMPPKNATITKQKVDGKDTESKIPTKVAKPIRNPSQRILDSTKNHVARLKQQKLRKEEEERLLREEELAKKRPRLPKRTKSLRNVDRKTLKVNQKKPKLTKTGNSSKEVGKGGKTGVSKEGEKKGRKRWELGGTSKTNSNESLIKKVEGSDSAVESGEQTTDTACTAQEQTKLKAKVKKRVSDAQNKESLKKKNCTENKKKVKVEKPNDNKSEILNVNTNEIKVIAADEVLQGKVDSKMVETTNKTENNESTVISKDVEEQGEYIEVLTEEERMRLINKRKMIDLRVKQWIESCENVITSEKVDESGNVRSVEEGGVIHIDIDENLEDVEETQKGLDTNQIESETTHEINGGDKSDEGGKKNLRKMPHKEETVCEIVQNENVEMHDGENNDVHPMVKGNKVTFDLNNSYIEAPNGDNQIIKNETVNSKYENKHKKDGKGNESIENDGDFDLYERQKYVYDGDDLKYEGEIETDELLDKVKEALCKIEHDKYVQDTDKKTDIEKPKKILDTESIEKIKNQFIDACKNEKPEYVEIKEKEKFQNKNNHFLNENKDHLLENKGATKQIQNETIDRIINHEVIMKKKQMPNQILNTSSERDEQERVFDSSRESGIETEEENLKTSDSDQETYQPEFNYIDNEGFLARNVFGPDGLPQEQATNSGLIAEREQLGADRSVQKKMTTNSEIITTVFESNDFEITTEESEFENNDETELETENETCLSEDVNSSSDIIQQKHIHKSDVAPKEYELQSTDVTNNESETDDRSDDESCSESEAGTYNIEDRNHEEKEVSNSEEEENELTNPQEEPNSSPIVLLSYKQLSIEIPDCKPLTNDVMGKNEEISSCESNSDLDNGKGHLEKNDLKDVMEKEEQSSEISFNQLEIEIPEESFINDTKSNHDLHNNEKDQSKEDKTVEEEEEKSSCESSLSSEEGKGQFDLVDAMSKSTGSSMQTIILTGDKEILIDVPQMKEKNEREIENIQSIEETSKKKNVTTTRKSSDIKEESKIEIEGTLTLEKTSEEKNLDTTENSSEIKEEEEKSKSEIEFPIKAKNDENAKIEENRIEKSSCQNKKDESNLAPEKSKNKSNQNFRRWSHDKRYTPHDDTDECNDSFSDTHDFSLDIRNDGFISNKGILSVETINFHVPDLQSKTSTANWADFSSMNESDGESENNCLDIKALMKEELKDDERADEYEKNDKDLVCTREDNKEKNNGWADFSVFNQEKNEIDPIKEEAVEEMPEETGSTKEGESLNIKDLEPLFTSAGREMKINDLSSDIVSLLDGKGSFKNLNINGNTRRGSDGIINHAPIEGKEVQNWADFSVLNGKNKENGNLEDEKNLEKDFSVFNGKNKDIDHLEDEKNLEKDKLKQNSDQNHQKNLSKEQVKVSHLLAEVSEKLEKIKTAEMNKIKEERSGDMNIFKDGINFNIPIHNFEIEEEIFREVEEGLSAAEKLQLCQDQLLGNDKEEERLSAAEKLQVCQDLLLGNDKEETEEKNEKTKKSQEEAFKPVTNAAKEQKENMIETKEEPELYLRLKKELKWMEKGDSKGISRNHQQSEIRTERKIPEQKIDYRTSFDDAWIKSSKVISNDSENYDFKEWNEQINKKESQPNTLKDCHRAEKKIRSRTKTSFNETWCKGKLMDSDSKAFQTMVLKEKNDVSNEKEIQISSNMESDSSEKKMVEIKNKVNISFNDAWNKNIKNDVDSKSARPLNKLVPGENAKQIASSNELPTSDVKIAENQVRVNTSFNDAWNRNKIPESETKTYLSSAFQEEIVLPTKEETQVAFDKQLLNDFSETKLIKNRNTAHPSFNDAWNRNKESENDFEKHCPSKSNENGIEAGEKETQEDPLKDRTSIKSEMFESKKEALFDDTNRMAENNYKGYCPSVLNGSVVESDQKTDSSEIKMVEKSAVSLSNEGNKNIQQIEEMAKDIVNGKLGIENDKSYLRSSAIENEDARKHDDPFTKNTTKKKDDKMKMGIRIRINQKDGAKENNLNIVKFHTDILKNVEKLFKNASKEGRMREEIEPSEEQKAEIIDSKTNDNTEENKWNFSVENKDFLETNETVEPFENHHQVKPVIRTKPRIAKPVTKPYEKTKLKEEEKALLNEDEKLETEESDEDIVERLKFNFNIDFETECPGKPKHSSRDQTKTKGRSSTEKKKKKGFDKFEIDLNISANKAKKNRRSKTEENSEISSNYLKNEKPFDLAGLKVDINKVKSVFENSQTKHKNEEDRANVAINKCDKNRKSDEGQPSILTKHISEYEKRNQINDLEIPNIEKNTLTHKSRQPCITSKHIESYSLERRHQNNSDIKGDLRQADNRSKLARQAEDVLKEKGILPCKMNKTSQKSTFDSKINENKWCETDVRKNGTIVGTGRQHDDNVDSSVNKCSELKIGSGIQRKKEEDTRRTTRRKHFDEFGNDVIKEKRRCERYRINRKNADRRRTITVGEIKLDQMSTDLTKERNRLKEEIRSCKMIEDKLKTDDFSNETQINTISNEPKINTNKENDRHYECNDSNEINKYGSSRRRTKTSGDAEYESVYDNNVVRNINGVFVDEGVYKKMSSQQQQQQQNEQKDQRQKETQVSCLNENKDFRLKNDTLNDNLANLRKNEGSRKGYQVIRRESNPSRIMQINKDEEPRNAKIQRESKMTAFTKIEKDEKFENDVNKEQEYQTKNNEERKFTSQEDNEEINDTERNLQRCLENKKKTDIEFIQNLSKPTDRIITANKQSSGRRRTKTEIHQKYKNENLRNETEKNEEQRNKTASNFNLNSLRYPEKSRRVRSKTDNSERIITNDFGTTTDEQFETNNEKNNRKRKNVVVRSESVKNDCKNRIEENGDHAGTTIIKMAYNMLKQVDAKKEGDFCVSDVIKTCALATMNKRRTIGTRVKPDTRKCSDKSSDTKSPKKTRTEPNDNGYHSEKSNNNRSSNESVMSEKLSNNSDTTSILSNQIMSDTCFEKCEKDVFKCNLCSKEFTAPEYVTKHFQRSHRQNEARYRDETAKKNESNINFELNWLDKAKPAA